jgi:hypothetical protein
MSDSEKFSEILKILRDDRKDREETRKLIAQVSTDVNRHNAVLFGDPVTKDYGLYEKQKADETFQVAMMEEFSAMKGKVNTLENSLHEMLIEVKDQGTKINNIAGQTADIALYVEDVKSIPKKSLKAIIMTSSLFAALTLIGSTIAKHWESIKKFF